MYKRIVTLFICIMVLFTLHSEDIHAQQGKILIECGDEVVEFPSYVYYISPFIKEIVERPLKEGESVSFEYDVDCSYLKVLQQLVLSLPKAARTAQGKKEKSTRGINGKTIFVTKLVNEELHTPLVRSAISLAASGEGCNDSDRMGPVRSKRNSFKKRYSLRNSWNVSTQMNLELAKLYMLSLEMDLKPITNLIAHTIIQRFPHGSKDKECLQGTLQELGFGYFGLDQLSYLKKHSALRDLKIEEVTVADYLGMNGQPSLSKFGSIDLSGKGLTGLEGMHLLQTPRRIKSVALHHNSLLGSDLNPGFPKAPFQSFRNLESLFLYQNKLTSLPGTFLNGVNKLSYLEVQDNYLDKSARKCLQARLQPQLNGAECIFKPQGSPSFGRR